MHQSLRRRAATMTVTFNDPLRFLPVLLALTLALVAGCARDEAEPRLVAAGIVDLAGMQLDERPLPLDGTWRVHWPDAPEFDGVVPLPSRIDEHRHPPSWDAGEGVVEFGVELRGLPRDEPLALYVPRLFPTVTRCVGEDGSVVVSGRNGVDGAHASAQLAPYVASLPLSANVRCTLRLFVASDRAGGRPGVWTTPVLGSSRAVHRAFDGERIRDGAFTAMLVTLGAFFLFQWMLRRDETLALFVALFNATAAIWHAGYTHLLDAVPRLDPLVRARVEYAAVPLAAMFGFGIALRIRPTRARALEPAILTVGALGALALALSPARRMHDVLHVVQPFVLVVAVGVLSLSLRALFDRTAASDARLASTGMLFPALAGAVDVLASMMTRGSPSTLGAGMFFLAVTLAIVLARRNARSRRAAEHYSAATDRFVPREFLRALGKAEVTDVALGQATSRDVTILFADIRGFTTISETLAPEAVFRLLNDFFSVVCPPIRAHGGFVDKYIGDAIMALFEGPPSDAVHAAIAMQHALRDANERDAFPVALELGIGVHVGHVMLGTLGEAQRFEATVISDAVNTTSRIEGLTKPLGCRVLISAPVAEHLEGELRTWIRAIGRFALKGKSKTVELVEVFAADPADLREAKRRHLLRFEEGLDAIRSGQAQEAALIFDELAALVPDDGPVQWWRVDAIANEAAPTSTVRSGRVYLLAKA
jgi:class 3 adenylate cyclase